LLRLAFEALDSLIDFLGIKLSIPIVVPTIKLLKKTQHLALDWSLWRDRSHAIRAGDPSKDQECIEKLHRELTLAKWG
jgi:hypothetical protein